MDDEKFIQRLKAKIERLTGTPVELRLDTGNASQLMVDLGSPVPEVVLGSQVLTYSGFARMAVEYAVAAIRAQRNLGRLEFEVLLARN